MRKLCITLASITTACASKANANSCSTIIEPHDWNFTYAAAAAGLIFLVLAIAKNIQFRRLPAADRHPRPPHPSILFCLAFIFFAKPVYDIVDSNINCCMPIGPGETERYESFGDCGCKHRCMPPRVKLGASQLLLLKEANAGNAEAARQIAQYYLDNSYLPADDKIAYEWFEKSARLGNQAAQQRMAYPPYSNLETAVTTPWKKYLAERGDIKAQHLLARTYAGMDHTGHVQVSDKLSEAVFWFFVVQEQCAKIPVPAKEIQYPCKDSADVTSYIEKYLERAKIDNAQVKARAWKATTSNPMP